MCCEIRAHDVINVDIFYPNAKVYGAKQLKIVRRRRKRYLMKNLQLPIHIRAVVSGAIHNFCHSIRNCYTAQASITCGRLLFLANRKLQANQPTN